MEDMLMQREGNTNADAEARVMPVQLTGCRSVALALCFSRPMNCMDTAQETAREQRRYLGLSFARSGAGNSRPFSLSDAGLSCTALQQLQVQGQNLRCAC
jgi:hypothetical protein